MVHDGTTVIRLPPVHRIDPDDFAGSLSSWLHSVDVIAPSELAELYRYANDSHPLSIELRHVLQNVLLARTLEHAHRTTRFYADDPRYAAWQPGPVGAAPRLDSLPLLDRACVSARSHDFIANDVTARSICHTSGTTGAPLDVYKSFQEVEFIQTFFSTLFRPIRAALSSVPLVLTFPNFHHGVPVPMPGIGMTFVGGVTDDTLIRDARRQIDTNYAIPGHDERISIISGLHHYLLIFTSYLIEQGVDPASYRMRAINVTGGHLPPQWLQFLERSWRCPINDRFTLTEVIGGASRLPGTDIFALDPQIVGEIVDPDTAQAIDQGVGLLALTNLHPFVQMQPLIRYLTGDLVQRVADPAGLRFRFLGKVKNAVARTRDGRREWLVFSACLVDALAEFPDVAVYDWFSNLRSVSDRTLGSYPAFSIEAHDDARFEIHIVIELRYAPHTRPGRIGQLRDAVMTELRNCPGTGLGRGLDAGDVVLDIAFVGPGRLTASPLIKV